MAKDPNSLYNINTDDLIILKAFFKDHRKQFPYVAKLVLNDLAFSTRTESLNQIQNTMINRSKGIAKSTMRVKKASGTRVSAMRSYVGAVEKKRFDSYVGQLEGSSMPNRIATLAARGGDKNKTIRGRNRLKSSVNLRSPADFGFDHSDEQLRWFLQRMDRAFQNELFIMPKKFGRMNPGIYTIKKGRIQAIWIFKKGVKIKHNPFLTQSAEAVIKAKHPSQLWYERAKFVMGSRWSQWFEN